MTPPEDTPNTPENLVQKPTIDTAKKTNEWNQVIDELVKDSLAKNKAKNNAAVDEPKTLADIAARDSSAENILSSETRELSDADKDELMDDIASIFLVSQAQKSDRESSEPKEMRFTVLGLSESDQHEYDTVINGIPNLSKLSLRNQIIIHLGVLKRFVGVNSSSNFTGEKLDVMKRIENKLSTE